MKILESIFIGLIFGTILLFGINEIWLRGAIGAFIGVLVYYTNKPNEEAREQLKSIEKVF